MNIKKLVFLSMVFPVCASQQIEMQQLRAPQHEKMNILLGLMSSSNELKRISLLIKRDLEFTGQFNVTIKKVETPGAKSEIKQWAAQGFPLAFYIQSTGLSYDWRLYETLNSDLITSNKSSKKVASLSACAHNLSDQFWPQLTGMNGFFSTKLVYGKQVCQKARNCKKYIYMRDVTDDTGETEELLVSTPTISVAPRWNRDLCNPLVLYSEYTKTNVRLISVDMKRRRKIVSNFDGVNMQVAYNDDGSALVYCLSRSPHEELAKHTTSQLYYHTLDKANNKQIFSRITENRGNNFSPSWGPNDTIFYASDAHGNGRPNICWHDLKTKKVAWLTQESYAACPSYCAANKQLAYTKMIDKKMQLFVCNLVTNEHKQLTFDDTNKDDCSWSPDGSLVVYSADHAGVSRLALYNVQTKEQKFLTPVSEHCSYPAWSPVYDSFPMVS